MSSKSLHRTALVFAASAALAAALAMSAEAKPRKNIAIERSAAVTGLAASHDLRREGNRLCFSDHFHYGSSGGKNSSAAAQAAAIESWSSFVDFEYGSAWASYARSSSKEMKCSQTTAGWGCDVSARPCR
jgi:hypothetical protein